VVASGSSSSGGSCTSMKLCGSSLPPGTCL
jgi:hypothetical protein